MEQDVSTREGSRLGRFGAWLLPQLVVAVACLAAIAGCDGGGAAPPQPVNFDQGGGGAPVVRPTTTTTGGASSTTSGTTGTTTTTVRPRTVSAGPAPTDDRPADELAGIAARHPQLTPADYSKVKIVPTTPPSGRPESLSDPAPKATGSVVSIPWKSDPSWIETVRFSQLKSGRAVAMVRNRTPGSESSWLEVYDLAKNQPLSQISLPDAGALLDCSPDGKSALVRLLYGAKTDQLMSYQKRLDVWSTDGQHVAGWEPYGSLKDEEAQPTSAVLLEGSRVATLNAKGKLVVWKLPACEALYEVETGAAGPLVPTPGRKYLGAYDGLTIRFYETDTGTAREPLAAPSVPAGTATAWGWSPDGNEVCMLVKCPGAKLVQWNLRVGTTDWNFPIPVAESDGIVWFDRDYLLVNGVVFSTQKQSPAWHFLPSTGGRILTHSPDQRIWSVGQSRQGSLVLAARKVFDDSTRAKAAQVSGWGSPRLGPKSKVALKTELGEPLSSRRTLGFELTRRLTSQLLENGMQVVEGEPYTLVGRATVSATGRSFNLDSSTADGGAQSVELPEQRLTCEVAFVDERNTPLWRQSADILLDARTLGTPSANESLDSLLSDRLAQMTQDFFRNVRLPGYVFAKSIDSLPSTQLDGSSTAGSSGSSHGGGSTASSSDTLRRSPGSTSQAHETVTMAARYSPSQPGILVTCGSDSARGVPFKVWEVGSQKPRRVAIKEPLTCCEVAEKAALAVAGGATGKVYVVQLTKQFDIRPFSGGPTAQAATSVAISNSGKRIAAGYYGGAVHVWEEKKKGDSKPVAELGFAVAGMAFLPDEQTLAVACDQAVRFYNTEDGSELDPIEVEGTVLSMALDPDTNTLAVGLNEGGVQLFDATTRDSKGMLAEGTSPRSLTFSPNGRQLAVGDMRGKINVWDVAESSRVIECDGKWQAIISLSFSTDGLTLAGVEERHRDVSFWMMPSARRPAGSKSKTPAKGHSSN